MPTIPATAVSALQDGSPGIWYERLADEVLASGACGRVVCASGISPSGPIHMGNLREVLTTHFVVEALRARGVDAVHLHSWDDYDRLRKVPPGVDASFEEQIGRPLSAVPDPDGELPSYADRFIAGFAAAIARLGVEVESRRQSVRYSAGAYNAAIRRAMDARLEIFDFLAAQQTPGRQATPAQERRRAYSPFIVYCVICGRDTTRVREWDGRHASWICRCGAQGAMDLADGHAISGKLVWKVDWPMRWSHEGVRFEPAGEDHHAPSGSFTVGRQIVANVYGGTAPHSTVYSFVQLAGHGGKMSGSVGNVALPRDALAVLEPAIVRWLYLRRAPAQSFAIDLSPRGIHQLYDEWDRFVDNTVQSDETMMKRVLQVARVGTRGPVADAARRVSFRLLTSVADITQGNTEQIARIVGTYVGTGDSAALLDDLEPRLGCALHLAEHVIPEGERTVVREYFAREIWDELDDRMRDAIGRLADGLADHWTPDGLTTLVYTVPKQLLGVPIDAKPTPEIKHAQRAFFKVVYRLLADRDTGPRLPTFLLSIGQQRARRLLDGRTVETS